MKILFISNLFPPHNIGGYELACHSTLKALQESGHDCSVLTSDFKLNLNNINDIKYNFLVLRELKLDMAWGSNYNLNNLSDASNYNSKFIDNFLNENLFDLIYIWNIYGLTASVLRSIRKFEIKTVAHLMDESLNFYQINFYKRLKMLLKPFDYDFINLEKYIDYFICMSNFLKNTYEKIPENKKNVIYSYVDLPSEFKIKNNYNLKKNDIKGVYIGQIELHKGVLLLAETIKKINDNNDIIIKFDFYGNSISNLDKLIEQKYSDYITIKRGLPRYDILNQFNEYDFGVFPSLWEEPFGFAQLELMSAGLPVISSGMGGSKEVFSTGNHIYFDSKNSIDLYNQIIWLINNYSNEAKNIGEKASKEVIERFSKEKYVANLQGIFNRLKNT